MNYSTFQNQVSSEKLTLAIIYASKRLMAWSLESGSIYKIVNFNVNSTVSIEDSGNQYTEVFSLSDVTASRFYHDRENRVLYLRSTGSDNPNGRFIVLTCKLFFSNAPITLPHDLSNGYEVYWEPLIKKTSSFGVEIDTINQTSEAIEGSGSLTLFNDQDFWPSNFDKYVFENKSCFIYSHNRDLLPSEAKLIFKGKIERRSYTSSEIQFSLKDLLSQLKDTIPLQNIEELGLRSSTDLNKAKQRMIFGRVYGHRPVNVDQVLSGYPLSGTISINSASNVLTGSGTAFLSNLSPDDVIVLNDKDYTIATITNNTSLTLTENYSESSNLVSGQLLIKPDQPKRYMNRKWSVAGHALRQPTTTIREGSTITRLLVDSTEDIYDGDFIYVGSLGSGELVRVNTVISSTLLTLSLSLAGVPSDGTVLFKPAVNNVRIDDMLLVYYRDYTIDASTGILTLSNDAEKNAAPIKQMSSNLVFNSTNIVTGTSLDVLLKPGSLVSCVGKSDFFEVLSIDSPTQVTLRTSATFTSTAKGLFKTTIFDPNDSVLTCDVLGRTTDGTPTGSLIKTAPESIKYLLQDMGLDSIVDLTSFSEAKDTAYHEIGIVIPTKFNETKTQTYRDVFNKINQSVLGSIIQNDSFQISYLVLQPKKTSTSLKLDESDILKIRTSTNGDKVIKTAIVEYRAKEYDYLVKKESVNTQQKTSDNATYIVKTDRTKTVSTVLCDQKDAEIHANRLSFILENASTSLNLTTKLQSIGLEVGSIVDISHSKLYVRYSSSKRRKLAMVESIKKNGAFVDVELVDLSNAFNRVACVTDIETSWTDTNEDGRLYSGFITDEYGLVDNDEDSFGTNLIW